MFKTFSGTLTGSAVNLASPEPAAGWVIFNDSAVNTYDLVVGAETVKVSPKETLKLQTNVATVSLNGTGAYRAICFQSLTSFRFFDKQSDLDITLNSTYAPDTVSIDTVNGNLLAVKDGGVTYNKLAAALQTLINNAGLEIIPIGGSISGTYDKSVLCLGSASVTGTTLIKGDLYQVATGSNLITNAGNSLTVNGSVCIDGYTNAGAAASSTILVRGDLITNGSFVAQSYGGTPGLIEVGGDFYVSGISAVLNISGSANNSGATLTVRGNLHSHTFTCSGGASSTSSAAGDGSSVTVRGSVSVNSIGGAGGNATSTGNAGIGASLTVRGDVVSAQTIVLDGGDATSSNAGAGGTLSVTGRVLASGISVTGGDCSSTTLAHLAGLGGTVTCNDLRLTSTLTTKGGDRSGATTGTGTNTPPDGGSVTVTGDLHSTSDVILDGGAVTTASISGVAGAGGTLIVRGTTLISGGGIRSNGGAGSTSSTQVGGAAGSLTFYGSATADSVSALGGASGASAVKGAAGNITFGSGCFIGNTVSIKDGSAGATDPSSNAFLLLGGSCSINTIDAVDRAAMHIKGFAANIPVTLKVTNLATKATFNDTSGTVTANISAEETKLFLFDGNDWYSLTGTSM